MSPGSRDHGLALAAVLVCAIASASCRSGSAPDDAGCPTYEFVLDHLTLPTDNQDVGDFAFDLDHNGTVDNSLGRVLVKVTEAVGEPIVQELVDEVLRSGRFIILLAVFLADGGDLSGANAANFWLLQGTPQPLTEGPRADGSFTPDLVNGPPNAYGTGKARGGSIHFGGDFFEFLANLALTPDVPLPLPLRAFYLEADVSIDQDALEYGRVGAAIAQEEFEGSTLPALVGVIDRRLRSECAATRDPDGGIPGPCGVCTPLGEALRTTFDLEPAGTGGDCTITVDEVRGNPLVSYELSHPDVTLKDGRRAFSIALSFTAVRARFRAPHSLCPVQSYPG